MESWDKAAVIEWFKAQRGQEIVIRMQGGSVRVQGRAEGVERLDACSTEIEQAEMAFGHRDMETSLSFHAETLGIHLIVFRSGTREVELSLPVSIPYDALLLSTVEAAKAEATKGKTARKKEKEEPEFSPYELLH